ncbi:hypothetical protein O7623_20260 [Solwaraspora sp. WMMD791]|uniref:hypothetical protein n=1 Tax=Solwaraspora sp. WMMD791 TaxID=3016086 RepID=UPI00249A77D7|nr:hypothetical protein [Solwaraspora sp. WMMD791]WFE25695.1 hypothetical protein O7623_20260 [Solwaraspora sp. WMMD791]
MTLLSDLYFGPLPNDVVTDTAVAVPTVLGGQGRIPIGPGDAVRMEGDRIVVGRRDTRKVPAWPVMAHRGDWESMTRTLRS